MLNQHLSERLFNESQELSNNIAAQEHSPTRRTRDLK
ncbi:hypothetical protein FHS16_002390 [Paenibacillus endophyticus]|uniref:Uncharacterized protein n=1 Tax=Paenibacillus endophyticus TaxID=1294268 RepID=A0A7W5C7W2_9BACL|nr:hypothetical protein [Paenibacillus endophyticus]